MENGARAVGLCAKILQPSTMSKVDTVIKTTRIAKNVHLIKVGNQLKAVQQIRRSRVLVRMSKVSTGVLGPLAALGFVVDVGTVVFSLNKLSHLSKGQLSAAAQQIQERIDLLQNEKEIIEKVFTEEC